VRLVVVRGGGVVEEEERKQWSKLKGVAGS